MAKKKSKRCSERRKTKTAVTNARKEAKLRREMNKNKKNSIKIPRSELMTDDEKQHLKNIKEGCEQRAKDVKPIKSEESIIFEKFKEQVEKCDCFIEVVDFRDIEGTRSKVFEQFLKEKNIPLHIYVNFSNQEFQVDFSDFEGLNFVTDFSQFKNFKKICIFGFRKVGKFLVSKNIEEVCGEKVFEFIKIPINHPGISEVFRGVVDMKNVDPKQMVNLIWDSFEKDQLQEFFRLSRFEDLSEFLSLLAHKISKENLKTATLDDAALLVLNTIKSGQIKWQKHLGHFYFKFIQ